MLCCEAQNRIMSERLKNFPYASFAYRFTGQTNDRHEFAVEWIFHNLTDSTISFTYRLTSTVGDTAVGRVTLLPEGNSIAGWYFRSEKLSSIDCSELEIGK